MRRIGILKVGQDVVEELSQGHIQKHNQHSLKDSSSHTFHTYKIRATLSFQLHLSFHLSRMSCQPATSSNQVAATRPMWKDFDAERNKLIKQEPVQGKKKHWWSRKEKRESSGELDSAADHDDKQETKSATSSRSSISSTDSNTCVRSMSLTDADRKKLWRKERDAMRLQKRRDRGAYQEYAAAGFIFF